MPQALAATRDRTSSSPESLTFGLARSREDLTQAFRLVFESYYRAGLVDARPSGIRLTPHHLLPTTEVLLARLNGEATSTVSIFGDGYLGLPIESMYRSQIASLRDQGLRIAEIGCLADRRESQKRFIETFAELGRLVAQVAVARGVDAIVAATHPRHSKLYQRVMGFRQIGDLTDCPYANGNPAVALSLRFDDHKGTPLYERYFGNPYPPEELEPYRWDGKTRGFFRQIVERDSGTPMDGIQGYYNWATVTGTLTA